VAQSWLKNIFNYICRYISAPILIDYRYPKGHACVVYISWAADLGGLLHLLFSINTHGEACAGRESWPNEGLYKEEGARMKLHWMFEGACILTCLCSHASRI